MLPRTYYLFLPMLYLGLGFITEPIGVLLLDSFSEIFPNLSESVNYFISVMLCELIRLFTVIIIKNYWKGNLIDLPLKINVFLCLIHILGIISCCIVVRVIWLYDIPEEWLLCTSIIFIVLFINILIFSVFKKMNTIYASIYEKEMIIQEAKLKEAYYSEVDKSSQYLRKIRHDLKNKLIGILLRFKILVKCMKLAQSFIFEGCSEAETKFLLNSLESLKANLKQLNPHAA